MKLSFRHITQPVRSAQVVRRLAQSAWTERRLLYQGERLFKGDRRFDLNAVTQGFKDDKSNSSSDAEILQRICDAYSLAIERQKQAPRAYEPTSWWQEQRKTYLQPAIRALSAHDIKALQEMYRNFFRDDCSTGLLPVQRMKNGYFTADISNYRRRLYLIDALYRLEHWRSQTGAHYALSELAGPPTGNPFGIVVEDTLIRSGSEYQHYCARRITQLLPAGRAIVAEIGGGFGGMAHYLVRDRPDTVYVDFDVPESIALASYYLLKAFPKLNVVLYGEAAWSPETLSEADIILMPNFEMPALPTKTVDLCFSSHALTDLAPEHMAAYLRGVTCMTRDHFLCIGSKLSMDEIPLRGSNKEPPLLKLLSSRSSDWDHHLAPKCDNVEQLFLVDS